VTCHLCGGPRADHFMVAPRYHDLIEDGRCYSCAYWARFVAEKTRDPWRHCVVEGVHYIIAMEGSFSGHHRGHGGRRFRLTDIRTNLAQETSDLWNNGRITSVMRAAMPDSHLMEELYRERV